MITCYVHFISAFLHMLMLIFLSIALALQWPADSVTRNSESKNCERFYNTDGDLMMTQSANRLIFVLLLVFFRRLFAVFIGQTRFEPHSPT